MSQKDRFYLASSEGSALGNGKRYVWVDRETGIEYLFVQCGYAGGLTPLLNTDGTPRSVSVTEAEGAD